MAARTQEQRKADTRARLIAAAADLFARKGFHAVSAETVADAADRTTGALYSHFGGKDGLLLEFELWLHGARDAEFAGRLAERYHDRRRNLAVPLQAWAREEGLGKLRHPERCAGLVIALLLGTAMQQRLDQHAFTSADVVAGLRAILEGDVH